jgi:excisionase family DNA binding protein
MRPRCALRSLVRLCTALALAGVLIPSRSPGAEVLTLEEAAELLRVTPAALRLDAEAGHVPGREVGGEWRFSRAALLAWLAGATPLESVRAESMASLVGRGPETPADQPTIGEAPDLETADQIFLRHQQVLLSPGDVVIEPSLFYTRTDARPFAVLLTSPPEFWEIERHTATSSLGARYGLLEETELLGEIVYERERNHVDLGSLFGAERDTDGHWSSLSLGLRRTLVRERLGVPNVVLTLGGSAPLGDTSYSAGVGLAAVSSLDPAILFGGLQFQRTFVREFDDPADLEHDASYAATLGYAFALNEALTLSMALTGVLNSTTRFDQVRLEQEEEYYLRVGMTRMLAPGRYVEPVITFLLNDGSGSKVSLGVNVPLLIEREE